MGATKTINQSAIMSTVTALPIFKDMNPNDIVIMDKKGNEIGKPVKTFGWILALGVLGFLIYGFIVYVLPTALTILGYTFGIVSSVAVVMAAIIFLPKFQKWLSFMADKAYRKTIENDPFILLHQKRQEFIKQKDIVTYETNNIKALAEDSKTKAYQAEQESKTKLEEFQLYTNRANKLSDKIKAYIASVGGEEVAQQEEEYYTYQRELKILTNDAKRAKISSDQQAKFVQVYGARGMVFRKLYHTLENAQLHISETVKDFDLSIKMLEDEYKSAEDAKRATQSAKNALGLSSKWEVEFAIGVVNDTINRNLVQTMANLQDISELTKNINNYDNPEEQLERLNQLNAKIEQDGMLIPSAKSYNNLNRKFTQEERINAGSFNKLFQ